MTQYFLNYMQFLHVGVDKTNIQIKSLFTLPPKETQQKIPKTSQSPTFFYGRLKLTVRDMYSPLFFIVNFKLP